jgi:Cu(I)/Ag(I) efflux system membrane fusion protein
MNKPVGFAVFFVLGCACGLLLATRVGVGLLPQQRDETPAQVGEREILYYRNPMGEPDISPVPKKDSMGMDYIPVYADEGGGFEGSVRISSAVQNNLAVRTATVESARLATEFGTVGFVQFDETRVSHVHLRVEGWIRKLEADTVGERVTVGQELLRLYSPALLSAQEEYIVALGSGNRALVKAAEERLSLLDVPRAEIERLRQERRARADVPIVAAHGGYVSRLQVREGMYVTPELELMTVGDIARVWVVAELFERELGQVNVGAPVVISSRSFPGRVWRGSVDYVYPTLDQSTRTARFRVVIDNADEVLKPNMTVDVALRFESQEEVLAIPRDALIRLGEVDRVVMRHPDGSFGSVTVRAGREYGERVEIIEGLRKGDTVVSAAQFLIDSESSIRSELARLGDGAPEAPHGRHAQPDKGSAQGHDGHEGHDADSAPPAPQPAHHH